MDKNNINSKKKKVVTHYRNNCIGCGVCTLICPKHWEMSEEDGLATLKDSKKVKDFYQKEIDQEDVEEVQLSAENCPVRIIKI